MKIISYTYNKMGEDYFISPEQEDADGFLVTEPAFKAIEALRIKPEIETLVQFLQEQEPETELKQLQEDAQKLLGYLKSLGIVID